MAYAPLPRFLFRAPLLPMRALTDRRRGLLQHPLGLAALTIASPHLVEAIERGSRPTASLDRYRRRAAFRPTPRGLLAGVGVGHSGTTFERFDRNAVGGAAGHVDAIGGSGTRAAGRS